MKPFIVRIVDNPEIAEDSAVVILSLSPERMMVGVSCVGGNYWTADTYYQDTDSGGWRNTSSFGTDSVPGLLGHLHAYSRSDIEKYLLMTKDVAQVLFPAMALPVVEYVVAKDPALT